MNASLFKDLIIGAACIGVFAAGTGGMFSADSMPTASLWHDSSVSTANSAALPNNQILSPAQCMASIRDLLQLNMSELANVLNISRPTAYSWLDGSEPNVEAQKYIKDLVLIAEKVRSLEIARMDLLIHRPIFDGRSFLDRLVARKDVSDALQALKNISDQELANRGKIKGSGKNIASLAASSSSNSTPIYRS